MNFQLSLRKRLALLVAAAMLPLLGLAVLSAELNARAAVRRTGEELRLVVSLAAASQQHVTQAVQQVLTAVAQMPEVQGGDAAACSRHLSTLRQQLPGYSNLGIIGPDGFVRCHGRASSAPAYIGDRLDFREAIARRSFVTGEFTMGYFTGKPVVTFALPMLDAQGRVASVAYATLDLGEMTRSLTGIALPAGATLGIHDRQGVLLAGSAGLPLDVGQKARSPVLIDALAAWRAGMAEGADSRGQLRLWAFAPTGPQVHAGFFVAVSMDRSLVVEPVHRQLALEMAALLLMTLLGAWMAWVLGGRAIVRPAREILQATRQLAHGRLDTRIAVDPDATGSEFAQIAAGLNRMAEYMQAHRTALEAELAGSQAARDKLQDAQRLARIGYWQIDLATQRITLSDEIYDFLEFSPDAFDGSFSAFLTRVHRDDRAAFEAACNDAIRTGATLDIEFRVVLPGGCVRWIHQFGRVHSPHAVALPTGRTGVIQDITERKNSELAIARSTELLNRTGAMARIGGWELDVQTMALYWSEEIYRIHELERGTSIDLDKALDFYGAEVQPVIHAAVRAALQRGTPYDIELPLVTAGGRQVWVRTQGCALMDNGRVVRLMGVLQDVSVQHQGHEHLRLLEACLSRLNDAVVITEAKPAEGQGPRIVFVNDAFERQTGFDRAEVLGQSPRILQGAGTRRAELDRIATALERGEPVRSQLINYTKHAQEFWGELDIVPMSDAKGTVTHWVSVGRDITQRKLAEQDLIDSEQRYATLFETAPVPMWVYDTASTRFLAVNQAAVRAYGYSAAEFLSMTLFDIRPQVEHDHLRHWLGNPSRKQAQWHDLRKDGSLFSVETVSEPIQYAGRAARLVVAVDKTSQDDAEKKTQEYLFTLQRAADAAQAITWHQTLEGTMQEIAEQARGVIGVHQAVVSLRTGGAEGKSHALSLSEKYESHRDWIKPPDNGGIYDVVCENNRLLRMTQAELQAHPQWQALGAQGDKYFPMHGLLAVPLIARNGKNIGVLQLSDKYEGEFTKQDEYVALELSHLASAALENSRLLEEISLLNAGLEQKVAERTLALARQEALFRVLAEQAPQLVWTADPEGRATYFNRAWFSLVGGELKDWTGYQWLAVVHPEDVPGMKANWAASQATQAPYAGIRRLKSRAGVIHTMSYRASPVLDAQGRVAFWVGIDADITEVKAIEAALRLSNQELEAFSYSVSHDLRAPLNTVDGFSRLLAKELALQLADDASAKVNHYLARIQAGAAQMGRLIEDLLSLSQVARAQLRTEPVDLSLMAGTILDEWQMRQPERVVALNVQAGLQAQGDSRLVKVMMENLLANAWKFTSKLPRASITVGQMPDASGLPVFFVKDDGAGFDMAFSAKLFDPFQRLHAVSEFSGTGIGLATVSRVIKRHGGRIWAESAPNFGATFFFTLPQSKTYISP